MSYSYRQISKQDTAFLKEMMYTSLYIAPGKEAYPRSVLELPEILKYYKDWGRSGDIGFILLHGNKAVGAIWARIYPAENPGYGFIDAETPEIGIALQKEYRNMGLGTKLFKKFLAEAEKLSYKSLSLSVDKINPAKNLYERLGFKTIRESKEDYIMQIHLIN